MTRITKKRANVFPQETEARIIPLPGCAPNTIVKTEHLINGVWQFANATLWFGQTFSKSEISQFKLMILAHFQNHKTPQQNFKELIQRICIAKRQAQYNKEVPVENPQIWLSIHNPDGLTGTLIQFEEIKFLRQYEKECEEGIKALANGLLLYMGSPFYFKTCVATLCRLKETDLVQHFYNTIINLQYNHL